MSNLFIGDKMTMPRGDSESFTVSYSDDLGAVPFVTGDKVYFSVKRDKNDTTYQFQKLVTTFTAEGLALVNILPADTKTMDFGRYVYDIQITFADGTVKTPKRGLFILDDEVTHD